MSEIVRLQDVDVRFGRVAALQGINVQLSRGERLALIGSNGSGKSTLLRVLNGLVKPAAGRVVREAEMRQAMVFQRPYMLRASALSNVALGLWIGGRPWAQAKSKALEALRTVDLADVALRKADTLSSGQQQRLALARAWSMEPDVLLLDEPTSSLDPHAKREVESLMADFAATGMTLVFASHNLGQVKRLSTRVIYLEHGRILADLPVHEFFSGPRLSEVSREADLFLKGEIA